MDFIVTSGANGELEFMILYLLYTSVTTRFDLSDFLSTIILQFLLHISCQSCFFSPPPQDPPCLLPMFNQAAGSIPESACHALYFFFNLFVLICIFLLPVGKTQNSSVMMSESDLSTDEETLFINTSNKKTNGFIQKPLNGVSKHIKTKLRA